LIQVDHVGGSGQAKIEKRDETLVARQNLRLSLPLTQKVERLLDGRWIVIHKTRRLHLPLWYRRASGR